MNIPSKPKPRGRPKVYPFDQLAPGDYFDFPRDMGTNARRADNRQHSMSNSARRFMRMNPSYKLKVECIDKETVRCTRVT